MQSHAPARRQAGRTAAVVTPATAPPRPAAVAGTAPSTAPADLDVRQRCDPLATVLARSVAQRAKTGGPVLQRWWAGNRQLAPLLALGKPWDFGGNPLNVGAYHRHIFLEDGGLPADIGHMGPIGLGQDAANERHYTKTDSGPDDAIMRDAIREHSSPGPYEYIGNNCQKWVDDVLATYAKKGGKTGGGWTPFSPPGEAIGNDAL